MSAAEVKAGDAEGGDYVPIKKRKIDNDQLKPKLQVCPGLCSDLRNKMYKWYPGPEIMMHKMHWTEWFFLLFLISAIVFCIKPDWPGIMGSAIMTSVISFIALIFVWGYAKYKSLADLAEKLEQLAMENHAEVNAYCEINDEWERSLDDSQQNLNNFTSSLGLVSDDANAIDELTQALGNLVEQKKKIQAEEKVLFQVSVKHQKVTRAEIDEKNRNNMKKTLSRLYDRIAKKTRGKGSAQCVDSPEEIHDLKEKMKANEFLNQKKQDKDGNELDEPMFEWVEHFDRIAEDGEIQKWELLDALDRCTNSYFLEIRDALTTRETLQKTLDGMEAS